MLFTLLLLLSMYPLNFVKVRCSLPVTAALIVDQLIDICSLLMLHISHKSLHCVSFIGRINDRITKYSVKTKEKKTRTQNALKAMFLKLPKLRELCCARFYQMVHCNLSNRSFVWDEKTEKYQHFADSVDIFRSRNTTNINLTK